MALIHENLYQSQNLAQISISDYIEDLVGEIINSFCDQQKDIRVSVETDECNLNIDTAIPCGLIINELVMNAFKHGFPSDIDREDEDRSPSIIVGFRETDPGQYIISINDNGIGLPEGIHIEDPNHFGLQLVHMMVEQLHGTIEMKREMGTEYVIGLKARNVSTM